MCNCCAKGEYNPAWDGLLTEEEKAFIARDNFSISVDLRTLSLETVKQIVEISMAALKDAEPSPPDRCIVKDCWHYVRIFPDKCACSSAEKRITGQPGCLGYRERKVGTA